MKINKIIIILALLAVLILPAYARTTYHINGSTWFGCADQEDFKKISGYRYDGDKEAFVKALTEGIYAGTATVFKDGEPVYLEDTAIWSGLVELRRPGETQAYWTNIEAAPSSSADS